MELYQRVRLIAKELAGSETKLAAKIGVNQRTLNGYLRNNRQDSLWSLLPQILNVYPEVSREWLYFGEGEMFSGSQLKIDSGTQEEWKDKYLGALEELNTVRISIDMMRQVHDRVNEESGRWLKQATNELDTRTTELHKLEVAHNRLKQKYLGLQSRFQAARLNMESLGRELEEAKNKLQEKGEEGSPYLSTHTEPPAHGMGNAAPSSRKKLNMIKDETEVLPPNQQLNLNNAG